MLVFKLYLEHRQPKLNQTQMAKMVALAPHAALSHTTTPCDDIQYTSWIKDDDYCRCSSTDYYQDDDCQLKESKKTVKQGHYSAIIYITLTTCTIHLIHNENIRGMNSIVCDPVSG